MIARMFRPALGAALLLHLLLPVARADDGTLARRFANPPAHARILKIIHSQMNPRS